MPIFTYDMNKTQGLALVATKEFTQARYIPIDDAEGIMYPIPENHLKQLHSLANAAWNGILATQEPLFPKSEWEVQGSIAKTSCSIVLELVPL